MTRPVYGWFGDDFTGATDTLATIAERGRRAFLFLDVPGEARLEAAGPLDAIGIASATRSMDRTALADAVAPAGGFFQSLGVRVLHYKCCSTFDSAPEVGNLAVAVEALRPFVGHRVAMILGGQPSLGRYCAFSNLFAAAGDTVHRLDRHPTMSRHPATPMGEADLLRHLGDLGLEGVVGLHWPLLEDEEALARRLDSVSGGSVLLDAQTSRHVETAGRALRRISERSSVLALGASSVAEAFFDDRGEAPAEEVATSDGSQVLAIAGSLSPTTRAQIAAARSYASLQADPAELTTSQSYRDGLLARSLAVLRGGRNLLVSTVPLEGPPPVMADATLARHGARLAEAILDRHPVHRLIAAGGDTSSHLVGALGLWGLAYQRRAAKGVSICRARSDRADRDGMQLLLKGGQMGDETLFDRFAAGG